MSIKNLAGQTIYYGLSNIVSKLLNYFLTPFYLQILTYKAVAEMNIAYAYVPFANIVLTYGMETAFFRYAKKDNENMVLSTSMISLICSTIIATFLLFLLQNPVVHSNSGQLAGLLTHPESYLYLVMIMGFDALTAIPFAQLRYENRPMKYAAIRVANILTNVFFNVFFLLGVPYLYAKGHHWLPDIIGTNSQVSYIFLSNVLASGLTFVMFLPQLRKLRWVFDKVLWKDMISYSLPLIIVGMAGMVNETMDRAYFLPTYLKGSRQDQEKAIAIYSANYKLAMLINMFIQAFKLGAEPFFFKQAETDNPQRTYARIMKIFVALLCTMFLFVALYLNIWKIFLRKPFYYEGLTIVPVLLMGYIFLGIYYNLTIWFKLTNQTRAGAIITLISAGLAFLLNWWWIPVMGYFGAALATGVCYLVQMIICYVWGQKYYPVPYHLPKLLTYILLAIGIYYIYNWINTTFLSPKDIYAITASNVILATVFFLGYLAFILKMEKKEFARLPVIGKFLR
ncbi:lipopolysaccharide biosynthesis protein [Chitinophaga sp. Cy-1792]|uniref:lipopolysaccharide biosynthesis protein n=1 Tax=Chitinophaga sp. Cy-1792 TaxID=2608339 RepID=UPI00141FA4B2|nr:polysaccharide biosynthesis C-terminal domain-containing protein [Chitinophaga sp. Cy-1792]NIG52733.1 oligosaccharide flippase family protein [Chitinophaga sp. Cy-1792]